MIKAVLFDLDGTLIDSPQLIMKSFEHSLITNNNYQPSIEEQTKILGSTLNLAFSNHANNEIHLQKLKQSFIDFSNENTLTMLNPYKNTINVIQYLRDKGYLVGIVTSNSKKNVNKTLANFKMDHLFDCIICFEDSIIHKPNAEPLLIALDKLNVDPSKAIYIGDHENDIKAGKNALMKTGLVGYSHRKTEALNENPTYVFDDLEHIKTIF